jgi:hypothetical protein
MSGVQLVLYVVTRSIEIPRYIYCYHPMKYLYPTEHDQFDGRVLLNPMTSAFPACERTLIEKE